MGRKGDHGGHHGGAWKVAYADFVTAMMALFIVLWILGSESETKAAISAYFNHPSVLKNSGRGFLSKEGLEQFQQARQQIREEAVAESVATVQAAVEEMEMQGLSEESLVADRGALVQSAKELETMMANSSALRQFQGQVAIEFTSQGLRIQLEDLNQQPLFDVGKPTPRAGAENLIAAIAKVLAPLPNLLLVEGHTDSRPYSADGTYSNWELSGDRANAARRLLEEHGLDPTRIARVIGYADRRPLIKEDPFSDHNRRISITVCYQNAKLD